MKLWRVVAAFTVASGGIAVAGAGAGTASTPPDSTPPGASVPGESVPGVSVPGGEIVAGGEWEIVKPGGDCQCALGTEYAFFVRRADPTNVVFFLEGGGACFDAATCAPGSEFYDPDVDETDDPDPQSGIFDFMQPDNPFLGYSFVYVPYCTGDVHIGNLDREYSPELTVRHRGLVNGTAAREYLAETFPDASQVVVVGESAGAIAAPIYAGEVSLMLPDAQITVFADGAGAYPNDPNLNAGTAAVWGATVPDWPVNEGLTAEEFGTPMFTVQAGLLDPEIVWARFDFAFDNVQTTFMDVLGIDTSDLVGGMDANEELIEAAGVTQWSFTAPGDGHTLVRRPTFYEMEVNGASLRDWVAALIDGETVEDVHCEECETP